MPDDAPSASNDDDSPASMPRRPAGQNDSRKKRIAAGIAFGIGSAALVAALLYAGRSRSKQGKSR